MTKNAIKPSIQAALDEAHPTGPHHHPSVRSSLERPDDVFDPDDPDQQGLPLAGDIGEAIGHNEAKFDPRTPEEKVRLSVTVDDRFAKALEQRALDAIIYGMGVTHIASGNEGVEVTNIPIQDMLANYMDFGAALRAMEAGHDVQREGWPAGKWLELFESRISLSTAPDDPWILSQEDILAKDWRLAP